MPQSCFAIRAFLAFRQWPSLAEGLRSGLILNHAARKRSPPAKGRG